jgi:hypothetical protein
MNGIPVAVLSNMKRPGLPPSVAKLTLDTCKRDVYKVAYFYKQAYVMCISIPECNECGLAGSLYVK